MLRTLPPAVIIALALIAFALFGSFRLGQFETTDEHLWKYDRIGNYWEAWAEGDWEATYINDKPGITVALFAGLGLLAEPHPENHERRSLAPGENQLFEAYATDASVRTNLAFRLPVLLTTLAFLALSIVLIHLIFRSPTLTLFAGLFLAGSPILLGLAQIINPDSFFWLFGFLAFLGYLGYLFRERSAYLVLAGVATGFALLSKYTAFLLFPLFGLALLGGWLSLSDQEPFRLTRRALARHFLALLTVGLIATVVFALFLPAVWSDPSLFLKGLSQFFEAKEWPLMFISGFGLFGVALLGWYLATDARLARWQRLAVRFEPPLLRIISGTLLALIALVLVNAWTGESLSPVEALRDAAYANEPQAFNFRPVLEKDVPKIEHWFKLMLMETAPLVFSLTPFVLGALILGLIGSFRRWFDGRTRAILFALISFVLFYFAAAYEARVVTNARYLILLYPLIAFAASLVLTELFRHFVPEAWRARALRAAGFGLLIVSLSVSWSIKPFYFSYTNFLLPQDQSIHDSWGHGSYEAAEYLNSQPGAERLVIWSNSDTVCRFFVGKCLRSRRIDLARVTPDYLVMSKRGIVKERNHPLFENNPSPERDTAYYIQKIEMAPDWRLDILGRPDNFIGIVRFEKE